MRKQWNEASGPEWVQLEQAFDRMLAPIGHELLRRAVAAPGEHVLDVGSGFGTTALALAAAVGADGRVMGLDISAPLLDRARQRGLDAAVGNVIWREGDAQVATLPAAHFDLVVSRFGVMFFDDPAAAFANLTGAVKPGGRLCFACWQPTERNPWYTFPSRTLAPHIELPPLPFAHGPGPFAFGDPDLVRTVLAGAGFTDVGIEGFETLLGLGADGSVESTLAFVTRGPIGQALAAAPAATRRAGTEALRSAVADHVIDGAVRFPAAVWFVTARR